MALKEDLLKSLKKAMQGEMDSVSLYDNAARNSKDPEVKEFFTHRKEEERAHYNYLLQYYQELSNDLNPTDLSQDLNAQKGFNPIISDNFIKRIGENQILFSAISTALLLEKDAIDHYKKCGQDTQNQTLKSFYNILVDWETKHYDDLLVIQKEAEVYYWEINRFEPF